MKFSIEELNRRKNLPLQDKIDMTIETIEKWHDHWGGQIYVAFSGGKDSLVLLTLVRSIFPEIPAVFNDTGLEYPEIKEFVKGFDNVITTKPKLTYRQVIDKYGFAVISKEQSQFIHEYRTTKSDKVKDIRWNGNKWGAGKISKKWQFAINAPFKISHKCCYVLKKNPSIAYEKKYKRKGMVGSTTEESELRKTTWLRFGCNAYDTSRPLSMPLAFWTNQDILQFLYERKISLATVYGEIKISELGEYYTTGVERTGCIWCLFGIHKEKSPNRFQKLKASHPKIWKFCLESMGIAEVLDFFEVPYE